ncbi:hypothetical protein CJ030_MR3G014630 [Morella rubra]|uniref:DUF674 domain-containing protein n=1 Tax=Morella rubra TaxID=262757 RepID=A0A6A1W576_9ROSI|nr:hypothetical protein CJ030_MR3G014630 [Morella rubra]
MAATKISIKLIVDKKANKVILAEAGKEFVDFLFHFLSLPIGAVIGLLSSRTIFGCIGNLYKSVEEFDVAHLHGNQHRDVLLNPRVPTTASTSLPLLLHSNHPKLYTCYYCKAGYVSDTYNSACPSCGKAMSLEVKSTAANPEKTGYLKGSVPFIVTDDLSVTPLSTMACAAVLNKCNIKEFDVLEESMVDFGMNEGLQLLRESLQQSKEILTSVFLVKEESKDVPVPTE